MTSCFNLGLYNAACELKFYSFKIVKFIFKFLVEKEEASVVFLWLVELLFTFYTYL